MSRLGLAGLAAIALCVPAWSAEAYAFRIKGEAWVYGFGERNAYFTAEENYRWLELMLRAQATLELGSHVVIEGRAMGSSTLGEDYYSLGDDLNEDGTPDFKPFRYFGTVDLLSLNLERLLDGKLTVKLGRQEIVYGEGFVLGDGYDEYGDLLRRQAMTAETGVDNGFGGAGQWVIPGKSWDAARISLDLEPVALDFMVARLNPTKLPDPTVAPSTLLPGMLVAADGEWSGEVVSLGLTALHQRTIEELSGAEGTDAIRSALALRGKVAPGDWKIEAEVVGEGGSDDGVARRALGARLNVKHLWSYNPFSPYVKVSAYLFSGDNPDTEVNEGYDALHYDWSDFGRWYLGDISASQWFVNNDNAVLELGVGFQPTPLQNLKLMLYGIRTHTGVDSCALFGCEAESGSLGKFAPLVAEANLVWDWAPSEVGKWKPDGRFYFGALAGVSVPMKSLKELGYDLPSLEGMLFMTVNL